MQWRISDLLKGQQDSRQSLNEHGCVRRVQITHIRSNENRMQFEQTRMLFAFVRAAFVSPRTAYTDLSRMLRDGVSLYLPRT